MRIAASQPVGQVANTEAGRYPIISIWDEKTFHASSPSPNRNRKEYLATDNDGPVDLKWKKIHVACLACPSFLMGKPAPNGDTFIWSYLCLSGRSRRWTERRNQRNNNGGVHWYADYPSSLNGVAWEGVRSGSTRDDSTRPTVRILRLLAKMFLRTFSRTSSTFIAAESRGWSALKGGQHL